MTAATARGILRSDHLPVAILLTLIGASTACQRSPQVAFARMLDQTASWAASIEFTETQQRQGLVPMALVDDVARHGANEVQDLQRKLAAADQMPSDVRDEAVVLSGRLAILLGADRFHDSLDLRQVRAIENRLRALARQVRGRTGVQP
jgi:hypothetical protein